MKSPHLGRRHLYRHACASSQVLDGRGSTNGFCASWLSALSCVMNNQDGAIELDGQSLDLSHHQGHGSVIVDVASATQGNERFYDDEVRPQRRKKLVEGLNPCWAQTGQGCRSWR